MTKKRAAISAIAIALTIWRRRARNARKRKQRLWVMKWLINRHSQGASHQLMKELSTLDVSSYRNFVRMDSTTFEVLLNMVAPKIQKQNTVMREAISPGERIALTFLFLAHGMFQYRIIL